MEKKYETSTLRSYLRRNQTLKSIILASAIVSSFLIYRLTQPSHDAYLRKRDNSAFTYNLGNESNLTFIHIENTNYQSTVSRKSRRSFLEKDGLENKLDSKRNKRANYQIQPLKYIPIEIPE